MRQEHFEVWYRKKPRPGEEPYLVLHFISNEIFRCHMRYDFFGPFSEIKIDYD